MGGEAGEERFGAFAAEKLDEHFCRRECGEAETREQEWVRSQETEGAEDFGGEDGPMLDEWVHQAAPTLAVRS
jgi:hypothetical protein